MSQTDRASKKVIATFRYCHLMHSSTIMEKSKFPSKSSRLFQFYEVKWMIHKSLSNISLLPHLISLDEIDCSYIVYLLEICLSSSQKDMSDIESTRKNSNSTSPGDLN